MTVNSQLQRLSTFANWPGGIRTPGVLALARASFRYTGESDKVECTECHVVIGQWDCGEDPITEHRRMSPQCPFLVNCVDPSFSEPKPTTQQRLHYPTASIQNLRQSLATNSLASTHQHESEDQNVSIEGQATAAPSPADYNLLKSEDARVKTFINWPVDAKVDPQELAMEGFIYTGSEDQVECVFCHVLIYHWDEGDVPELEHRKHSPRCGLVTKQAVGNVPLWSLERRQRNREQNRLLETVTSSRNLASIQSQTGSSLTQIDKALSSIQARAVLNMGFRTQVVQAALQTQLRLHGRYFETADALLQAVMASNEDENTPDLDFSILSNLSQQPEPPSLASGSDSNSRTSDLPQHIPQQSLTSSPANPAEEQASRQIPAANALDINAEASAAEAVGANKKKNKAARRREKAKKAAELAAQELDKELDSKSNKPTETPEASSNDAGPGEAAGGTGSYDIRQEELKLIEENSRLKETRMCKVCFNQEVETVFLPCGHLVCCSECGANVRNCVVCRALIRGTVKIFLS